MSDSPDQMDSATSPTPADPLQAQTSKERREAWEDFIAHLIAILLVLGFFGLSFVVILGYVDLTSPVVSALVGSVIGYSVAKLDPVLVRYYHAPQRPTQPTQSGQR